MELAEREIRKEIHHLLATLGVASGAEIREPAVHLICDAGINFLRHVSVEATTCSERAVVGPKHLLEVLDRWPAVRARCLEGLRRKECIQELTRAYDLKT